MKYAEQIVGRERRERVSQLARYDGGCFDSRRRVNSTVRLLYNSLETEGGKSMLFKSNVPTSHRMFFVLAGTFTFKALLELRRGIPPEFAWAVGFWLITMYLWLLRRKWRLAEGGSIDAHYSAFDRA